MADTNLNLRWSLQGKTALVTGGTRGIGKAIAEELARLGASVFICSRTQSHVDSVLLEWKEMGFSVQGCVCDVSSSDACSVLVQKVSQTFGGKLDILVNNAGTFLYKSATVDVSLEETSFLMSTDFHSAFNITKLSYPYLKASGKASVVFISSVAGAAYIKIAGSVYSAAKAAMDQTARYLACEWAKDGIRVNSVAPGFIFTDLIAEYASKPDFAKPQWGGLGRAKKLQRLLHFYAWTALHIPLAKLSKSTGACASMPSPLGLPLISRQIVQFTIRDCFYMDLWFVMLSANGLIIYVHARPI